MMNIDNYFGECIKPALWIKREEITDLYIYQSEDCCYKRVCEVFDDGETWLVTCDILGLLLEDFLKSDYFGLQELQQELEEMIAEESIYKIKNAKEIMNNITKYWRNEMA